MRTPVLLCGSGWGTKMTDTLIRWADALPGDAVSKLFLLLVIGFVAGLGLMCGVTLAIEDIIDERARLRAEQRQSDDNASSNGDWMLR